MNYFKMFNLNEIVWYKNKLYRIDYIGGDYFVLKRGWELLDLRLSNEFESIKGSHDIKYLRKTKSFWSFYYKMFLKRYEPKRIASWGPDASDKEIRTLVGLK